MIHCNGVKGWLPDIRHQNINRSSTMTTQNGKRKLPRRELPWIGTLLDNLSFSKLPTNGDVLRRLMFELERHSGTCSLVAAKATVTDELMKLWEYAGYGDILHIPLNIQKQIQSLHDSYKALNKIPASRRNGDAFKKKKDDLLCTLKQLFDISVKQLHFLTAYH